MTKFAAQDLQAIANEKGIIETLYAFFGTSFSFTLPVNEKVSQFTIEDIDLSVRSYNALKRSGISTVNDLIESISSCSLLRIRNLGKKSINEIKTRLLKITYENMTDKEKLIFWESVFEKNT